MFLQKIDVYKNTYIVKVNKNNELLTILKIPT